MDLGIISMRYAKALLLFAEQQHEEKQVYDETAALAQSFLNVPKLEQALLNPVLSNSQKEQLLLTAACGNNAPSTSLQRFVQLITKKMRTNIMPLVAHAYGTLYRKKNNIIRGKLVVPATLPATLIEKMQQMVEAKSKCKVDFEVQEDATIGGGFILEYDTYRLDASVRTQLAKLKRELI